MSLSEVFFKPVQSYFLARRLVGIEKLSALTTRKSVAVVGNASSLLSLSEAGSEIESHDIVIRFNAGFVTESECQGTRTDIACLSLPLDRDRVVAGFNPQMVFWLTPKWSKMPHWPADFQTSVEVFPKAYWQELYEILDHHRPTSGCMMLYLLANYILPDRVTIYGFDFFQTPTNYHQEIPVGKKHAFHIERKYVEGLCESNPGFQMYP